MPFLIRGPVDFKDPPGLKSMRHMLPGAAGVFFRLSPEKRAEIDAAQRRNPRGPESGLAMLERIVAAHSTERHLQEVDGAAIKLAVVAIEQGERA